MRVMPLITEQNVASCAAAYIVQRIIEFKPTKERPFVLGLPTGTSPLKTYEKLVQLHKDRVVSFEHVVTFSMVEYVGLSKPNEQSFWHFMQKHLFSQIDIKEKNINFLNGCAEDIEAECLAYEARIKNYKKINLFLCEVGQDGHVALNGPYSSVASRTRLKNLAYDTRLANASFFHGNIEKVPQSALTVGIATILEAEELLIIATGLSKAVAVQKGVEGPVNHTWTISALQLHPKVTMVIDEEASQELKLKTINHFTKLEAENISKLLKIFAF